MSSRVALLIGAYGGEHIGDAAVLGGVLIRLARRENIARAVVVSFDPDRTRRLVALIDPAVPLEVTSYDLAAISRHVRKADLLVWAGGPMGDWPLMLARNLATAAAARARGIPFVLEGIGIGRLRRPMSTGMVIALLKLATVTTVRSAAAAVAVTRLAGRHSIVAPDPAFDYVATRSSCDLTTPQERVTIEELTSRPSDTRLICINARPAKRAARQLTVSGALKRLSLALTEFARIHPTRYVFFPLETEANTRRDLDAAEELARHLPAAIDFRIWSDRPSLDGTLCLLRHADAAVTMRFHAAVFARSQAVPTIGLQFSHGSAGGKVSDLFADLGETERVVDGANFAPDDVVRLLVDLTVLNRSPG